MDRVKRKRGPVKLPFTLKYRNIYIVPTTFGFAFGLMLIFMALGGLNFNNNMALLLVFLLGAIAQMTTLLAYRNMVELRIENVLADPVFAGDSAQFRIYVSNPAERDRFTLQAGWAPGASSDCIDLAFQTTGIFSLLAPTARRGWLPMPNFRLETRFPLGMFRAWSWMFPSARCLVYPAPAYNPPPLPRTGHGQYGRSQKGDGEQVHGLRKYQPGDSLKRVAWKTSARHDELYTREMESPREEACELAWDLLTGVELEERLSILTAWVLMADHRQLSYSLQVPGDRVETGSGLEHRNRCLELLSVYGL